MQRHIIIALAALALSTVAFSQAIDTATPDAFQIRYVGNVTTSAGTVNDPTGNSLVVNITNSGTSVPSNAKIKAPLCVNVYAFDPQEELLACCTCQVTPNGLVHISIQNDIAVHLLTPATPNSYVIKLLATSITAGTSCDPGNNYKVGDLASGMRAWGTTLHFPPGGTTANVLTEGAFLNGGLSQAELNHITQFCGFIEANGTGFGTCSAACSPANGALGGAKGN
jgi:hypothetical protein